MLIIWLLGGFNHLFSQMHAFSFYPRVPCGSVRISERPCGQRICNHTASVSFSLTSVSLTLSLFPCLSLSHFSGYRLSFSLVVWLVWSIRNAFLPAFFSVHADFNLYDESRYLLISVVKCRKNMSLAECL